MEDPTVPGLSSAMEPLTCCLFVAPRGGVRCPGTGLQSPGPTGYLQLLPRPDVSRRRTTVLGQDTRIRRLHRQWLLHHRAFPSLACEACALAISRNRALRERRFGQFGQTLEERRRPLMSPVISVHPWSYRWVQHGGEWTGNEISTGRSGLTAMLFRTLALMVSGAVRTRDARDSPHQWRCQTRTRTRRRSHQRALLCGRTRARRAPVGRRRSRLQLAIAGLYLSSSPPSLHDVDSARQRAGFLFFVGRFHAIGGQT
ncbi:hypothetical protein AWB66_05885 [Caballeronia telluris]|uniref:Uncharacterized protein n=1 Tax=Caballeronia telluris TaxID=326475 RepID=A0A158KBY4_9BURK|nr:hypothetical protein AWB66_05885 [Caballeronia telluris]